MKRSRFYFLSLLTLGSSCFQLGIEAQPVLADNGTVLPEAAAAKTTHRIALEQRAFFLEKSRFTLDLDELNQQGKLGLGTETELYKYSLSALEMPSTKGGVFDNCAVWDCKKRGVLITAKAKKVGFKSYVGIVWLGFSQLTPEIQEYSTHQLVCASQRRETSVVPQLPKIIGEGRNPNEVSCPDGFLPVSRSQL